MTASKAKMNYINRYNSENYEKVTLQVKKGVRDVWRKYASDRNQSVVAFVSDAIDYYISEGGK